MRSKIESTDNCRKYPKHPPILLLLGPNTRKGGMKPAKREISDSQASLGRILELNGVRLRIVGVLSHNLGRGHRRRNLENPGGHSQPC